MKQNAILSAVVVGAAVIGGVVWAQADRKMQASDTDYLQTIHETARMVYNPDARALAKRFGLDIVSLTWEDTARYKNSAVGPNISDMTIQVGAEDPDTRKFRVTCMPVIRYPNFSDKTCDLDPQDFTLLVGNQRGESLKRISLLDFLANPTAYLTRPQSWKGQDRSLLSMRDGKVLVSAQACFLPVPRNGKATFNPVLFNYVSRSGDPAVLTVLATREGSSVTVIDNKRDAFKIGSLWGQRLFHNLAGQRASLTGQRISDFQAENPPPIGPGEDTDPGPHSGLNMVLLIQIPLRQKHPMRFDGGFMAGPMPFKDADPNSRSDVEEAVIGHGQEEGPFTEIGNLAIERDRRYPVRVTVQFYKATSNGLVSETDMRTIKEQIDRIYSRSASVGSLVTEGKTGRVTEYQGAKVQPWDWWKRFFERHQSNTGDSPEEAKRKLRELLGDRYWERPVCDLYLRDLLKRKP